MLKWAVNGPRQTYLKSDEQLNLPPGATQTQRRRLKRKSSDACMIRPKHSWHDKENQFTSTPLHPSSRSFSESPSRKLDSLKDLSNIVPDFTPFAATLKSSPNPPKTSKLSSPPQRVSKPNTYASTLPTFDVEYSPCALIPGPLLALRGVGIPDSYFEKPRYLTPHPQQMAATCSSSPQEECLETKTFIKPKDLTLRYPQYMEESSLSSSKMGDVTLERMIDAILESNRKERKTQKLREKHTGASGNMSPTYTPADDPASDLHEIWDSDEARYRQKEQQFRARLTKKCLFNEREVGSPHSSQQDLDPGQLKRQGGVRRKRKITKLTASVMNSAHKLLTKASQQTPLLHSHNLRKVFENNLPQNEDYPEKLVRHLSPDSGHNSSSEYEDDEEDNDLTLGYKSEDNKTFDVTKKRLSFKFSQSSER